MSQTLSDLKNSAVQHQLTDGVSKIHESLQRSTEKGLAMVYTITPSGEILDHHISISRGGQVIAHSAAMTLAAWIADCLNIPCSKIVVPNDTGRVDVRHVVFLLTRSEQKNFEKRDAKVLTESEVDRTAWQRVMHGREEIIANSVPGHITSQ